MMQDYDGAAIVDATGRRIGTVERTYVDDGGAARFVEVKIGALLAKQRLIPVTDAQRTQNGLAVSYTKDAILASPDASAAGETLEGALLKQVRAYYAGNRESSVGAADERTTPSSGEAAAVPVGRRGGQDSGQEASTSAADIASAVDTAPRAGSVREQGDVIEIPIVEDEVVTRPVVKEVLRVRKERVTEPQTIRATLRKEGVQITQDGDVIQHVDQSDRAPGG